MIGEIGQNGFIASAACLLAIMQCVVFSIAVKPFSPFCGFLWIG